MGKVAMTDRAVVVVGAGPTGMMLASELALAGVDVGIVERGGTRDIESSRAGGLHARTIEVLDQRGIAERFLAEGNAMQVQSFAGIPLDVSDFPTRHNYGLALWQRDFERILRGWLDELGVPVEHNCEVTGFSQRDSGVNVQLSDGRSLQAGYLVGCDGGRSAVRKAAGIEFPGWDPTTSWLIAEFETAQDTPRGILREGTGVHALHRMEDGRTVRVVLTDRELHPAGEATLQDLRGALVAVYGTDFGVHSPTWISRFTDMTRQAASYRKGRVLLAGDAAHVHAPQGGQGLNTGVQDAVNLGWKLAQVVKGTSSDDLLDTYHAERHPVGARVQRNTMAQVALSRADERTVALRDTMIELLQLDEPRRTIAGMISGLDIHYDLGKGHALLGRRMPDLDLVTTSGRTRVFDLLHEVRPVALNFGPPGRLDLAPWAARVRKVDASYGGAWELPVVGRVTAPTAVLIRPDGHVAWVGDPAEQSLRDALNVWFGPPSSRRARRSVVSDSATLPRAATRPRKRCPTFPAS
ncbi:MAG TPA: FAD-dependent monooxygenase [Acidimicrobiales bacterium]|nr:FAD-dependent monooxygenase [Acidimicrobiales bacterium]